MATLYVMVGIPGSGKSTYVQANTKKRRWDVVCPDTYRERFKADDAIAFGACFIDMQQSLKEGRDVVFDATNTVRVHRKNLIAIGRPYAQQVICIWMDTPLAECLRRHAQRQQKGEKPTLTADVLERMQRQLEADPPMPDDGFNDIVRITATAPGS